MKRILTLTLLLAACARPDPRDAQALHLSLPARVKSLDPAQNDDLYSEIEASYAYEPLLEYHYLKRPYALVPRLTTALPTLAADHVTYTIQLRDDVRFGPDPAFPGGHGRAVTAEDVIYSWRRLADPRNASPAWWLLDGKIAGLNAWREASAKSGRADYAAPIEGLRASGERTLVVKLVAPSPLFLYDLAAVQTAVVAREMVEKYGAEFGQHASGTGPYRLTENVGGTKLVFDRNPAFRLVPYPAEGEPGDREAGLLADAGKALPLSPRIVTYVHEESLPAWLGLLAGQIDVSSIPKDSYATALPIPGALSPELRQKGLRVLEQDDLDLTRVSFNLADPLLARNQPLRQALSLAFDTNPLIQAFYNGQAVTAEGPIPPGMPGFDPALRNPYRGPDLARAKALLAEAGYPGGKGLPPLEFVAVASATARQISDYIQRQFASIGVTLKIESYSWPEYVKRVTAGRGQLWSYGWVPSYPDADSMLQLFYGKNASPGPNDMHYRNARFDTLYEKARSELDGAKRALLYREMAKLVVDDLPCIFLVHRKDHSLAHAWLKNVKLHNFALDAAKYWRVDGR